MAGLKMVVTVEHNTVRDVVKLAGTELTSIAEVQKYLDAIWSAALTIWPALPAEQKPMPAIEEKHSRADSPKVDIYAPKTGGTRIGN
jgi:hypothetical protein